jgi:hypothetical protein
MSGGLGGRHNEAGGRSPPPPFEGRSKHGRWFEECLVCWRLRSIDNRGHGRPENAAALRKYATLSASAIIDRPSNDYGIAVICAQFDKANNGSICVAMDF